MDLSVFQEIEGNLGSLTIEDIKERLASLFVGMKIVSPIFDAGLFLYRGRKISPTFNKERGIKITDLIYPPKDRTTLGRLNREGQPVFYSSMNKESVFFELGELKVGDEVILSFWKTTEKMFVNNIGYTEYVFERLGATRPCPKWVSPQPGSEKATVSIPQMSEAQADAVIASDQNHDLRKSLSKYFMCEVHRTQNQKYKLTTAIGELHLGDIVDLGHQFAGILYPSVRMWANGDNLAVLPWFVDQHLEFRKAVQCRIDSREATTISLSRLDSATSFDANGQLTWVGRVPNWTLQPGQTAKFTGTAGVDRDGDYEMSADGPCHWVATDVTTGALIEAH